MILLLVAHVGERKDWVPGHVSSEQGFNFDNKSHKVCSKFNVALAFSDLSIEIMPQIEPHFCIFKS
jgi:hypothetical protein